MNQAENRACKNARFLWRLDHLEDVLVLARASIVEAVDLAECPAGRLDFLLLSLTWTDDPTQQQAARLTKAAGLSCPSFEIVAGTSGGCAVLEIAGALVKSGQYRRIAVVSSCKYGHFSNLMIRFAKFSAMVRVV